MSDKPIATPLRLLKELKDMVHWWRQYPKDSLQYSNWQQAQDFARALEQRIERYERLLSDEALCSSIPRAQIEALEAELRSHAEQEMESDRKFWTRSMRLDCKVEMECADRLRALLHPELKG